MVLGGWGGGKVLSRGGTSGNEKVLYNHENSLQIAVLFLNVLNVQIKSRCINRGGLRVSSFSYRPTGNE